MPVNNFKRSTFVFSLLITMVVLAGCRQEVDDSSILAEAVHSHSELEKHSAEFKREVIKVTDGVYVAVGFGLANSIMLEGDTGVVIVDTLEGTDNARAALAAFREITDKPVEAIVLTHNHADHIFGASVFAEGDANIPIYAHESTNAHINKVLNVIKPALYERSARMFGTLLPPNEVINDGIGPFLELKGMDKVGLVRPNRTVSDRLTVNVAGIELQLIHAPGETDDQIMVWLPNKKVLLPADNIYKSFPNLYTIRGTAYRDVLQWVASLDKMRALQPEFLVPSHGRPLLDQAEISMRLTNYRDAIQYVHDQTLRGINQGKTPEQLVEEIALPEHLAEDPYLQPFYGSVAWSVRGIFSGYLGWFSGSAVDLNPLTRKQKAILLNEAFSQQTSLIEQAEQALQKRDYQWALELAEWLLALDADHRQAQVIKTQSLHSMAYAQDNAPGRNYLLSQAKESSGELRIDQPANADTPLAVIQSFPIDNFMRAMPVNLKAEDCLEKEVTVSFQFPDVAKDFTVYVRNGVAEVQPYRDDKATVNVKVNASTWKSIVSKHRNIMAAYSTGELTIDGSVLDLVAFIRLFESA